MIFQDVRDPANELTPPGGGRPEHRRHIKQLPDVLDVVAVVSNPIRYRSRYDLFRAFEAHVQDAGARLTVVELAFGQRPFEVTESGNPRHVQVRSPHEFWAKENLINLGVSRLPRDSRYVAWVDADVTFARTDWVQETLQQLQHYPIVQMFSEAHDLDPHGMLLTSFRSFAWSNLHGVPRKRPGRITPPQVPITDPISVISGVPIMPTTPIEVNVATSTISLPGPKGGTATATTTLSFDDDYYGGEGGGNNPRIAYWHHPGFAWAARREAFDAMGGLFDVPVVGEADYIMAKAIVGEAGDVLYPGVSPAYRKAVYDWQANALGLRFNIGFVPGSILHAHHGPKRLRTYWDRCKILAATQFDPTVDLKRDWQGVHQLVDDGSMRSVRLRDLIRTYFRNRDEDSPLT